MKFVRLLSLLVVALSVSVSVMAQAGAAPVQCGTIIESEFTADAQPQRYVIEMAPGDVLTVSASPLGDTLLLALGIQAPNGAFVGLGGRDADRDSAYPSKDPAIQTGVLSARGQYTITAHNAYVYDGYSDPFSDDYRGGIGVYTLYIGCTLRDGTVIAPGDAPSTGGGKFSEDATTVNVPFSGVGFPGLPSVDFSNAIAIPFQMGEVPNVGSIATGFESVFGFTFEGSAGDTFALSFARLSGNMSLNLTVLSSNNEVAYQATLVTSSAMSSTFTLPSSGTYTVGVSKSTVGAPAMPETTTFQLTGKLNP